jgi:hypothetical protein
MSSEADEEKMVREGICENEQCPINVSLSGSAGVRIRSSNVHFE